MRVAVVTDSTACLPTEEIDKVGGSLLVVPLGVGIDAERYVEGIDIDGDAVADAQAHGRQLRTSRPAPAAFLAAYAQAAAAGAEGIVSVHCSGGLSSTVAAARTAAAEVGLPVEVVDSGTLGMGMGFAALAGAARAHQGDSLAAVTDVVRQVAASSVTTFYVDSLEPLRRGGRIGRAEALLGSALAIKPLLTVTDGVIEPIDRVRTTPRAMRKLVQRTVEAVGAMPARSTPLVAVHALSRDDLAVQVAEELAEALAIPVDSIMRASLGAVVAAHVGAGTVATVVATAPTG